MAELSVWLLLAVAVSLGAPWLMDHLLRRDFYWPQVLVLPRKHPRSVAVAFAVLALTILSVVRPTIAALEVPLQTADGPVVWGVVITLAIMCFYSIGVMIEVYWTYNQATKRSRKYAPEVARLLKEGKIKEATDVAHGVGVKDSHLAKVLAVGMQYRQDLQKLGETKRDKEAVADAAKQAIQRATGVYLADLKRRLAGLATIGATAPFVGLFGSTFGIINAFSEMALTGSGEIAAVSAGIANALITTALGLFVAVPAVWAYNYFAGKVEGFNVEMDNSSSELLDYFIKKGA